ncbi:hypothetical protein E3N88_13246 [Mikania micrantha]|uniref:Uncharacterized protein n=1 Tax=Mikania micrantha TaxID=192012 RepID=A0A5N6PAD1_9ASTR|nr:hypothetical protein E3N88_13246 [Mikania micrantha]
MEFQLKNPTEIVKNKKQESMVDDESLPGKWRMEEDEGLRTVECLRGRLLAERAASKAANDESEQISKKVVTELENQLKMEIKSRNKAVKKLKFLMKKLDSLKSSYVSADETSSFSEKSKISSVSSSKSQQQIELQKDQISKRQNCPSPEDNLGSLDDTIFVNFNENLIQSGTKDGGEDDSKKEDNNGSKYHSTKNNNYKEESNQDIDEDVDNSMALVMVEKIGTLTPRNDEDQEDTFDTSMALVVVDSMVKEYNQDVSISNESVKDVLDALRYARESLQTSMDMRRHMESNIVQARLDRISC